MQGGVGLGGSGLDGSGVGEASGADGPVGEGEGSIPDFGVAVENETLTSAVGEAFWLEGGMNGVGVAVGPQAANRHKNTQYEIHVLDFVLRNV